MKSPIWKTPLLITAVQACAALAPAHADNTERPNIVLFLVDDMGWADSSIPFGGEPGVQNHRYHTPNMERLAREGMIFSDAYATPVCTPSRVSLMTGMNAAHHRVTNWTSLLKDTPSDLQNDGCPLEAPGWNLNGLSPEAGVAHTVHARPLPELLKDTGYFTIHVGKAHFAAAGTPGASPFNLGFVVNISGNIAGMPQSYYGEENYGNEPGKANMYAVQNMTEYYGTPTHLTEALTLEALKALEYPVERGQPFFLYLAHYAVHTPVQADPRFIERYQGGELDEGQAAYASMVEGVDKSLGDLMDFLEAEGIADDTVILFMSDNGGNSVAASKGGQKHLQNLPLREGKASVYEGGIREPMIVKWPGKAEPGSRSKQPVIIEDFFPTILEIAGAAVPELPQPVDGVSFVPALKGHDSGDPDRLLVWNYPHKWKKADYRDIDFLTAARKGKWKLVYRAISGRLELYDLQNDIGETDNVAGEFPTIVRSLAAELGAQLRAWDAQMPVRKDNGQQVPWPDEIKIPLNF